jgi:DNA-binding GntR family transcriptional regulator
MAKRPRTGDSLADHAYKLIRENILRGKYRLGAALSRRGLASELGMSFLPVTEAIKRLEQDGLVESKLRVGTRVKIPTVKDIREHFILREALEVQVARLFAEKASRMERREIRAMAAQLDAATEQAQKPGADNEVRFQAQMFHLSFHMRIAECTGCSALCAALERNQVLVFNWLYDVAAEHQLPQSWHSDLAIVLAGSDVAAADAAMRAHVRNGVEEIQSRIVRYFSDQSRTLARLTPSHTTDSGWRVKASAK